MHFQGYFGNHFFFFHFSFSVFIVLSPSLAPCSRLPFCYWVGLRDIVFPNLQTQFHSLFLQIPELVPWNFYSHVIIQLLFLGWSLVYNILNTLSEFDFLQLNLVVYFWSLCGRSCMLSCEFFGSVFALPWLKYIRSVMIFLFLLIWKFLFLGWKFYEKRAPIYYCPIVEEEIWLLLLFLFLGPYKGSVNGFS